MPFFLYSFVYLVMVVMIGKEHGGMVASWNPDAEPVEIKIEVYGLGRYYGLHGDKNNLSVPLDILEMLSTFYHMDLDGLYKVYSKGQLEGVRERGLQPPSADTVSDA